MWLIFREIALRTVSDGQSLGVRRQIRVMHHVRTIDGIDRGHPIIKPKWEVLIKQVRALFWTA